MVREWGMSKRIGPMAWGSQGAVFLGEDLMHSRDYSDETARVIDEEVERILRDAEDRTRAVLLEHRPGLDAIAKSLLEKETVSGDEVATLVDDAMGHKVGGPRELVEIRDATPLAPSFEDGRLSASTNGNGAHSGETVIAETSIETDSSDGESEPAPYTPPDHIS